MTRYLRIPPRQRTFDRAHALAAELGLEVLPSGALGKLDPTPNEQADAGASSGNAAVSPKLVPTAQRRCISDGSR